MMTTLEMPSVLSSSQRRCQVLLMLYLPDFIATEQRIGEINGVDHSIARQDSAIIGSTLLRTMTAATGLKAQHLTNAYACCTGCGVHSDSARISSRSSLPHL